jgi:hypothetical protein
VLFVTGYSGVFHVGQPKPMPALEGLSPAERVTAEAEAMRTVTVLVGERRAVPYAPCAARDFKIKFEGWALALLPPSHRAADTDTAAAS